MTEPHRYEGGCHCHNLRYVFSTEKQPRDWPVRRCTCSYCVRLGARYTSGADTGLDLTVRDASSLAQYEFGSRTAEFIRCGKCGVMALASCEIGGKRYAVLNINTLDDLGRLDFKVTDIDFDAEQVGDRLARRQRNWIPDVSIRFISA